MRKAKKCLDCGKYHGGDHTFCARCEARHEVFGCPTWKLPAYDEPEAVSPWHDLEGAARG